MSEKLDYGGSAFPCEGGATSGLYADPGMTMRQWYAGQALASAPHFTPNDGWIHPDDMAARARKIADAMVREMQK